jgi:hypoxanthine-guanine phosphoribosyltransferase
MTRLSSALGSTYASDSLRTKTFELGGHTFKVRVPLTREMELIQERIEIIDESEYKTRFEKMTTSFKDSTAVEGIVVTDDDVIIEGRSTRELVRSIMQMENRTVEYIKLIVPEHDNLDDITYKEIDEEWPFQVQLEVLNKISEAIQPGYKDSRKN